MMQWHIIPAKQIDDVIIAASGVLHEINYQKSHQVSFRHRSVIGWDSHNTSIIVSRKT